MNKSEVPRPSPIASDVARRLRRDQTEAEEALWNNLRAHRLDGFKFRRQEPLGPFFVDFVCLDQMLVIELDGYQHAGLEGIGRDLERTAWLASKGYRVIRFTNDQVLSRLPTVLADIRAALPSHLSGGEVDPILIGSGEARGRGKAAVG